MSASANLIANIGTVITNGPGAATTAKAINPTGPILDYPGMNKNIKEHFQETLVLLAAIKTNTNAADSANLTIINAVLSCLTGGSSGSGSPSVAAITGLQTVYTNGPGTLTKAACIAPGGPIMDYPGCVKNARRMLEEAKNQMTAVQAVTDSGDSANAALLVSMQLTLS